MAGLAAAFNGLRTIMDRRSILDGVARGPGATRATAFVATRQITPQGRGLLRGPIDEGVDCLEADGPQPRFVPGFQPTGDLFGRPFTCFRTSRLPGSATRACGMGRVLSIEIVVLATSAAIWLVRGCDLENRNPGLLHETEKACAVDVRHLHCHRVKVCAGG